MKKIILILPVLAGILWGSVGVFVRIFVSAGFDNITIFFVRVLFSTAILFVILLVYDRKLFKVRLKDLWVFLVCGLVGSMGLNISYNVAVTELAMSFAAVLLALSPVFVMIIAAFVFKEKITARKVICMIIALAGCVLVSGIVGASEGLNITTVGVVTGIVAAVLYAVYSIFSRIAADRGYNIFTVIFYCMLFPTILLVFFADWGTIGSYVSAAPAQSMTMLILHAVCTSVLPYLLFTVGLAKGETGIASILAAAAEPAAATVFGLIVFAEQPTVFTLVGLVLTIVALVFLVKEPKEEMPSENIG